MFAGINNKMFYGVISLIGTVMSLENTPKHKKIICLILCILFSLYVSLTQRRLRRHMLLFEVTVVFLGCFDNQTDQDSTLVDLGLFENYP